MKAKYQAPRGTNDILPGRRPNDPGFEIHRWQYVESEFLGVAWQYGYEEIRTPMFEDIELFIRSSGDTSDIVSKEMYDFRDKGDRHVALKPEGTAPVLRAYLEHNLAQQGSPSRLCYINHSFRYGRPGKGRYRQLHQLGLELIGSDSPLADAEIISATDRFFRAVGLESHEIRINCIGRPEDRERFAREILGHLATVLADTDSETRNRYEKNPVRLLDSKDPKIRESLAELKPITDFIGPASRARFEGVQAALREEGIEFKLDPLIVRGLDYYTDTVFEIVDTSYGEGLSLCGGGRYDLLIAELGGPPTPSVGVGIGEERLIQALDHAGAIPDLPRPDAYIVNTGEDQRANAQALARELRDHELSIQLDIDHRGLKQQFKAADRSRARFALVLGEEEAKTGTVTVKNLADSSQQSISREEIADWLEEQITEMLLEE